MQFVLLFDNYICLGHLIEFAFQLTGDAEDRRAINVFSQDRLNNSKWHRVLVEQADGQLRLSVDVHNEFYTFGDNEQLTDETFHLSDCFRQNDCRWGIYYFLKIHHTSSRIIHIPDLPGLVGCIRSLLMRRYPIRSNEFTAEQWQYATRLSQSLRPYALRERRRMCREFRRTKLRHASAKMHGFTRVITARMVSNECTGVFFLFATIYFSNNSLSAEPIWLKFGMDILEKVPSMYANFYRNPFIHRGDIRYFVTTGQSCIF